MTLYNIFRFLLIFYFLIAMHTLLDSPGGTGLYLSFNIMSWLVVTLLIVSALWQVSKSKILLINKSHVMFLIGFICLCIPYFYDSEFKDHVVLQLLAVGGGLLLLVGLNQFKPLTKQSTLILWLILSAVFIQSCVGFLQFFVIQAGDWSGFDPSKHRPFGLFLQPNVMASFLATGIAIALFLSQNVKQVFHPKNIFFACIIFTSVFLLVTLNSRAGYFGAAFAVLLLTPLLFKKNKKLFAIQLLVMVAAIVLAKVALSFHPLSEIEKNGRNIQVRQDIYQISTQMILDKPLSGYGYGSFERSYLEYHNNKRLADPKMNPPLLKLDHPHNEILYWGVEGGLVALIGLLCFVLGYVALLKKIPLSQSFALAALVTPIIFHSQVEFPFYSSASHWIILILLVHFTLLTTKKENKIINLSSSLLPKFFSLLIFIIFVPFFITTFQTAHIVTEHEKHGHQTLDSFKNIINPLPWRSRIEANINAHRLIIGYQEKDLVMLAQYVQWGLNRIKHTPRISLYNNLLVSLKVLKHEEQYQALLNEAKQLYPDHQEWKSEHITNEQRPFDKVYL